MATDRIYESPIIQIRLYTETTTDGSIREVWSVGSGAGDIEMKEFKVKCK